MYKTIENVSLSLLNVGYVNLNSSWDYKNVMSPFFRLYYITDGEAKVFHHQQTYILKPGYMYLIPSFTFSRYKCDVSMTQFYISAIEVSETGMSIFSKTNFIYEVKADHISLVYFKRILELNPNRSIKRDDPKVYDNEQGLTSFRVENQKLSESSYLETTGLLKALISKFVIGYKNDRIALKKNAKLNSVQNFINVNLHTDLTVQDLANSQSLNVDYFSRLFKEVFGMRPIVYIQKKRIERAQLLLIATDTSLQDISDTIGFSNLSYFSRVFKKETGKSPLQYRKERRKV
ncbi:AraC family transcriptional regulator [Wenyingzhuangia sp. 2_MG-2023]|uniref:helix-turn-helix domain-containing protein n=1 Tax=Wenyingzhuangia sp. 2_MG-2023 TaxID=3062639 RepID=UPI0026E40224|nr:AraC family transcriptional regulator [Wenyingzhuangia sp. 2_MG-2023]MDO6738524.1 AraC family transcriptional regulator [Wenyingzhuangia sp. 2_MG-2023]